MNHEQLMSLISDHYDKPRNYGVINDAGVVQEGGNQECGDLITLYMNIDEDGLIDEVSFEGNGCMISQAITSILLDKIRGANVTQIEEATSQMIFDILGKRIVKTRPRCAHLALNTLKVSVKKWRDKKVLTSLKSD